MNSSPCIYQIWILGILIAILLQNKIKSIKLNLCRVGLATNKQTVEFCNIIQPICKFHIQKQNKTKTKIGKNAVLVVPVSGYHDKYWC